MPGGEERGVHPAVVVRPPVEKAPALQPGTEGDRHPIKREAATSLWPLGRWGRSKSDGIHLAHGCIVLPHPGSRLTPFEHCPCLDLCPHYSSLPSRRAGARPEVKPNPQPSHWGRVRYRGEWRPAVLASVRGVTKCPRVVAVLGPRGNGVRAWRPSASSLLYRQWWGPGVLWERADDSGMSQDAGTAAHHHPAGYDPEAIETTRIHSVAALTGDRTTWVTTRPCRAPPRTISDVGLVGGGHVPMPGEVSLAHNAVLFLDERPEFRRHGLKAWRQPLEEGLTRIPLPTHPSHTVSTPPLRPWGMTAAGPAEG
jgi:hypothetical protein